MTVELKCVDIDNFDEVKDFRLSFDEAMDDMVNKPYHDDVGLLIVMSATQIPNQFMFTVRSMDESTPLIKSYASILTLFRLIIGRLYTNNIIDKYIGVCKYSIQMFSKANDKQVYEYEKMFPVGFRKSHISTDIDTIDCIFRQATHNNDIDLFIKLIHNLNDNAFAYFNKEYSAILFGQHTPNLDKRKYQFISNNIDGFYYDIECHKFPVEFRAAFMSELRSRGIGCMEGDPML